jgi:putative ABC transport system permease protein
MGNVGGYQVARTASSDPASVAAAIARAIQSADPAIPVFEMRTMGDRMYQSMARQRFATLMLGAFAAFALLLAMIGVYGVLAHLVAQGRHEIGVRMALGAPRGRILAMVIRQGLELTGAGVVLGILGALALTRVMASLLFGISATDAITFGLVPLLLIVVALAACLIPARRATTVDPQVALRVD